MKRGSWSNEFVNVLMSALPSSEERVKGSSAKIH